MADQEQQKRPIPKPASGIGSMTPAPGTSSSSQPATPPGSPGKFAPVGSTPAGTGKFSPVRGTGKFAPVGEAHGTGKLTPVGSTNKFPPVSGQKTSGKFTAGIPVVPPPSAKSPIQVPASFQRSEAPRPRSAPAPGSSGSRLSLEQLSAKTTGKKPGGQWTCSSCGAALGPQSVMQGTGIILDGKLICVSCVKSGKRRVAATIPPHLIWGTLGGTVGVLAIAAFFVPGQVFLIALVLSLCAVLTGLIGFTLTSTARLGTVAAGLCIGIGSVYGLITLRDQTQAKLGTAELIPELARINDCIDHDAVSEAIRLINTLDERAHKSGSSISSPACLKMIEGVRTHIKEWEAKNYGPLSEREDTLLFTLIRKFGSTTANASRRFRALKIADKSVHLTLAVNSAADSSAGRMDVSSDPSAEQAIPIVQTVIQLEGELESIELKLVSATPGGDVKEIETINLDAQAIQDMRNGDVSGYQQALPGYSGPKAPPKPRTTTPTPSGPANAVPPPLSSPPTDFGPPPGVKAPRPPPKN